MGVINRDIKLENILLINANGRPYLKMCDFGYSINQNHSLPETAVGTPGYTGTVISLYNDCIGLQEKRPDITLSILRGSIAVKMQ